jgi:hypothetical protein
MKSLITFVLVALSLGISSSAFAAPKEAVRARPAKVQHIKRINVPIAKGAVAKATKAKAKRGTLRHIPRRTRVVKH